MGFSKLHSTVLCSYSLHVLGTKSRIHVPLFPHAVEDIHERNPYYGTQYYGTVCNFSKNEQLEKNKDTEKEFVTGRSFQFI